MTLFTRKYEHKLNAKGRHPFPIKVEADLFKLSDNESFITEIFCLGLILHTVLGHKKIYNKSISSSCFDIAEKDLIKKIHNTAPVREDNLRHFFIPKLRVDHAKLMENIMVKRGDNLVEICSPDLCRNNLVKDGGKYSNLVRGF